MAMVLHCYLSEPCKTGAFAEAKGNSLRSLDISDQQAVADVQSLQPPPPAFSEKKKACRHACGEIWPSSVHGRLPLLGPRVIALGALISDLTECHLAVIRGPVSLPTVI